MKKTTVTWLPIIILTTTEHRALGYPLLKHCHRIRENCFKKAL